MLLFFTQVFVDPNPIGAANFFCNFPQLGKYDLIRFTPYHLQLCILQLCDITKDMLLQNFSCTKKHDHLLKAVSSLQPILKIWLFLQEPIYLSY